MGMAKQLIASTLLLGSASADDRLDNLRHNARLLPDVRLTDVEAAVEAAISVETPDLPASLLVSIMWGESRFVPDVRTGRVCGVMQVNPSDIGRPRSDCTRWKHDIRAAAAAGVKELQMMLGDRRVSGNLRKALLYRACGNSAFDGTCKKGRWPGWVLRRATKLRSKHTR